MHEDFTTEKWKNQLEKLPEIESLKQALREFSEIDFSNKTLEEIDKAYFSKINIYPGQILTLEPSMARSLSLFRVRNKVNLEMENINLVSTFSYPPSAFCNWNGRANTPKCPVFYCASDPVTSLKEVKPQIDEDMFMSFWKVNCDRDINFTPILSINLPERNVWKQLSKSMFEQRTNFNNEVGEEKFEELMLLYDVFSFWFEEEETPYSKSSWIANKYLYRTDGIDFIVYPSFAMNRDTCSIAFHPNFVDSYLKLEEVVSYRLLSMNDGSAEIQVTGLGIPTLPNIIWRKPTSEDLERIKIKMRLNEVIES